MTEAALDTSRHDLVLSLLHSKGQGVNERHHEESTPTWLANYVDHLLSLPLASLQQEPQRLIKATSNVDQDLQSLVLDEYQSIVKARDVQIDTEVRLDDLRAHLDGFESMVTDVMNSCKDFDQEVSAFLDVRSELESILDNHDSLLDLLEIPQLMETCVRNGYYQEAMDLSAHVTRLANRHSEVKLLQSIQHQTQQTLAFMQLQLIRLLQKPIRLPVAMNIVGNLRRMRTFGRGEMELRVAFLKCRRLYFQALMLELEREVEKSSEFVSKNQREFKQRFVYDFIKKAIDLLREHLFEVATQYTSIFQSSTPRSRSISESHSAPPPASTIVTTSLLPTYTTDLTKTLLDILRKYLPQVNDTASLSSILTQLMYCGMSLGRVGLDFRHLVCDEFEAMMWSIVDGMLTTTGANFASKIEFATKSRIPPSQWMVSRTFNSTNIMDDLERSKSPPKASQSSFSSPPQIILSCPALAHFTNGVLSAFNALRPLAPISLFPKLRDKLDTLLRQVSAQLQAYLDAYVPSHDHNDISIPDANAIEAFVTTYVRCVVSYLHRCLCRGVYGSATMYIADSDLEQVKVFEKNLEEVFKIWLPQTAEIGTKEDKEPSTEKEAGAASSADADGDADTISAPVDHQEEDVTTRAGTEATSNSERDSDIAPAKDTNGIKDTNDSIDG
ncbi:hypothetical protein BZG36_02094 [Bifiguratus adelaidae]|uniref:Conserved oligomeric Golgi complex subunit 8 n=1 Tax=Bifiguratus adelaidae TaxID=1938954 RepID=A0A261Y356_9FUNG|nr:hypothetical protein BZG36_02094 [Bifiguratus adelaidae]